MWRIRSIWWRCKLTATQLFNHYIAGTGVTEKGLRFYDYCAKVVFQDYEVKTFEDTMFEDSLQERMKEFGISDRKTGAIVCGGGLAKHIHPSVFWSNDRPGKIIQG